MSSTDERIPLSTSLDNFYHAKKKLRSRPVNKRVLYLSIQVFINAVIIGFVAKALVYLIDLITNIFFYGKFSFQSSSPAHNHLGWIVLFIPVIGGLLVGLMARFGSKAISGHGIPEAMEKIILGESRIPPILTFLKPISAAISIGTGGPFGAEGPIIATGGAFGSLTGQLMHISSSERKIVLAAGACAGMSAIFGSPLAAVMLAVELLLFEFSPRSIIPVALGCVTGAGMHLILFGNQPVFSMVAIPSASDSSLFLYVLFGLIIGVFASLISKSIYIIEDLFEKIPLHWMWWPAIGALAVGITGYFAPVTMGVGYDNIRYLLNGSWSLSMLLFLGVLKFLSWSISLGSGTSGGTLAPLFTIGGALGALLGISAIHLFPGLHIDLRTVALVGMAAMFAGASRALLTSIIFALETTGQSNALLPLLASCIAAYFVSFFLMKGSIMTEKIIRRGVKAPDSYEPDILKSVAIKQLVTPLTDNNPSLPFVYAHEDAGWAAELMGKYQTDTLMVRDKKNNDHIIGMIKSESILKYYSDQKQREHVFESPSQTKRLLVKGRRFLQRTGS
ncbi:MAG: chloride channel protein [Flavisolibacter sp.]